MMYPHSGQNGKFHAPDKRTSVEKEEDYGRARIGGRLHGESGRVI
jgi:hypothetical protein